ncbi:MAG: hypothetical protein JSS45_00755 [Proteobacteria bacterium]|nr:hypothetical protein [Pseudomonadota bacterium]
MLSPPKLPFVVSLSNHASHIARACGGRLRSTILACTLLLPNPPFVVSLSNHAPAIASPPEPPFVLSHPKLPFVVSLSNHASHIARACGGRLRSTILACTLFALAACASSGGVLQTAGVVDVYDMQLHSDLDWSRIKDPLQHEEIWTIDGMALNSLSIFSGIADGQHVFMLGRERSSRPDGPWFHRGMRPEEIRDIVVAAMIRQNMLNVATQDFRPHDFGGVPGLRFEFTAVSADGLIYKGTVAAAERNGKLDLLLWKAPAEYYFDRDAAAVARMLDGLRFR